MVRTGCRVPTVCRGSHLISVLLQQFGNQNVRVNAQQAKIRSPLHVGSRKERRSSSFLFQATTELGACNCIGGNRKSAVLSCCHRSSSEDSELLLSEVINFRFGSVCHNGKKQDSGLLFLLLF